MNIPLKAGEQELKSWSYTEVLNKQNVQHEIALTDRRFIHEVSIKQAGMQCRSREEIDRKRITAVNGFYGLTRNLLGAIVCLLMAVICIAVLLVLIDKVPPKEWDSMSDDSIIIAFGLLCGMGFVLLIIGLVLLSYKRRAFSLVLFTEDFTTSYAPVRCNAVMDTRPRRRRRAANTQCELKMPPEVGFEILDNVTP